MPIEAGSCADLPVACSSEPERDAEEASLVAAAQADPLQFAPLYERYFEPIYRYMAGRVAQKSDLDDLVSTVFLRALHGLSGYRGRASFRSWLFSIAHNLLVDHYRRRREGGSRPPEHHLLGRQEPEPGPEARLIRQDLLGRVGVALARLPLEQQEAIVLRFSLGLRVHEVALVLGKRDGAVKMLIHRGLRNLRRQCESEGWGE